MAGADAPQPLVNVGPPSEMGPPQQHAYVFGTTGPAIGTDINRDLTTGGLVVQFDHGLAVTFSCCNRRMQTWINELVLQARSAMTEAGCSVAEHNAVDELIRSEFARCSAAEPPENHACSHHCDLV